MKTVSFPISSSKAIGIVNALAELGYMSFCIPGSLQDNFICDLGINHGLKIGRFKMRKYVLIREVYQNPWSSGLELELTDDDSVYEAWMKHYEDYLRENKIEIA